MRGNEYIVDRTRVNDEPWLPPVGALSANGNDIAEWLDIVPPRDMPGVRGPRASLAHGTPLLGGHMGFLKHERV